MVIKHAKNCKKNYFFAQNLVNQSGNSKPTIFFYRWPNSVNYYLVEQRLSDGTMLCQILLKLWRACSIFTMYLTDSVFHTSTILTRNM